MISSLSLLQFIVGLTNISLRFFFFFLKGKPEINCILSSTYISNLTIFHFLIQKKKKSYPFSIKYTFHHTQNKGNTLDKNSELYVQMPYPKKYSKLATCSTSTRL